MLHVCVGGGSSVLMSAPLWDPGNEGEPQKHPFTEPPPMRGRRQGLLAEVVYSVLFPSSTHRCQMGTELPVRAVLGELAVPGESWHNMARTLKAALGL